MSTLLFDGLTVEVSGEGQPLLCIHGLGGSSNTWTPVLPALAGFQAIRFDLPGSARSALPSEALSIEFYVRTIEQLLERLELNQVHLVAHSMGTIVAAHFAAKHPQRVRSLVLFGPLLAPPEQGRAGIRARAELARSGLEGMQEIADAIVQGATSRQAKEQQPAVLALVREIIMRQSAEGYAQSCEALADAQPAAVENIGAPALLITGDQDGVAPAEAVRAFAARLPRGRVEVFEDCGHWTTFEKPHACMTQLTEFYRSIN